MNIINVFLNSVIPFSLLVWYLMLTVHARPLYPSEKFLRVLFDPVYLEFFPEKNGKSISHLPKQFFIFEVFVFILNNNIKNVYHVLDIMCSSQHYQITLRAVLISGL